MHFDEMPFQLLAEFANRGLRQIAQEDPILFDVMYREYQRQVHTLSMVAASSIADPSVLLCEGSVFSNVTTEGYPGHRLHGGCEFADAVEALAVQRAMTAFGARYANVQPHSGTGANQILLFNFLKPGDRVLGLDLACGGHLTHGARASISGQYFEALAYGLGEDGLIEYTQVRDLALRYRPKIIICGASAHPRTIDFRLFREIADEAGALLLADISHIAGLVAGGCHPSPIDHAHFTTTSTYKQLYGPRGGLILIGRDYDRILPGQRQTLSEMVQRAVFPVMQGTPKLGEIAAKARALAFVATPNFKRIASLIVADAKVLAEEMLTRGYHVLTGGTDNHMVLLDVSLRGLTGIIAQRALEKCRIVVNRNVIPKDTRGPAVTSGIRIGTNALALRGMNAEAMAVCSNLIDTVLSSVDVRGESEYDLPSQISGAVCCEVEQLCSRYPIPDYTANQSTHYEPALTSGKAFV
jgi:glycine hydroxymethyltransferase